MPGSAILAIVLAALGSGATAAPAGGLPEGFVYLGDVDPTIAQDIRYAGSHNFVGRPVAGYGAAECVLTRQAAEALGKAQKSLAEKSLSLIVWDCYRPTRAVAHFKAWSQRPDDGKAGPEFFPATPKAMLFKLGYIAGQSAHSRGSTVDVGIAPANRAATPPPATGAGACTAAKGARFDDGAIDFGSGYDCFDPVSGDAAKGLTPEQTSNRLMLKSVMEQAGFAGYPKEWWHFTLAKEPFARKTFDFPILPRTPGGTVGRPGRRY